MPAGFRHWIRKHRLTAVISPGHYFLQDWLRQSARDSIEWPVQFASLTGNAESEGAGIDERMEEVGKAAVGSVIGQIQRNATGLQENPETIFIEGRWRRGGPIEKR